MKPYRGKRIDNGEEVKGWYFERSGGSYIIPITDKYHTPASFVLTLVPVSPETVGQFVCADKNGKDVYAGTPIRYAGKDYPEGFSWDEIGLRWTLNDGFYHSHYGATGTGGEDDYFDIELIEEEPE